MLNEVIETFKPLESIKLLDYKLYKGNYLYKIEYQNTEGWIIDDLFSPVLPSTKSVEHFYIYGDSNDYLIENDNKTTINGIGLGTTLKYLLYKHGKPSSVDNYVYNFQYFTHILANPAFTLKVTIENKVIIKIEGLYSKGD